MENKGILDFHSRSCTKRSVTFKNNHHSTPRHSHTLPHLEAHCLYKRQATPSNPHESFSPLFERRKQSVNLVDSTIAPSDIPSPQQNYNEKEKGIEHKTHTSCFEKSLVYYSLVALAANVIYTGVSIFCALDEGGKDVYFEETNQILDLISGLEEKISNTSLTIKTNNYGYFQTAFQRILFNPDSPWHYYDCFLSILITAGVSSIISSIGIFMQIKNLESSPGMRSTLYPIIIIGIAFACFITGNGFIASRLYKFHSDFSPLFQKCNCPEFESNYLRSSRGYAWNSGIMAGLLVVLLGLSLIHYFTAKKRDSVYAVYEQ